jgi:hypothetical protein
MLAEKAKQIHDDSFPRIPMIIGLTGLHGATYGARLLAMTQR